MLPPGKYYVGDLCYVMHPQWDEFCELTISDHDCLEGEFRLASGVRFATYGTAYGDGRYSDQRGLEYSVDAGLIGCIRVEDIDDREASEFVLTELGHVHEFDRPFRTWSDGRVIHFGHLAIDTDPPCEEEEDDFSYEEDEG